MNLVIFISGLVAGACAVAAVTIKPLFLIPLVIALVTAMITGVAADEK